MRQSDGVCESRCQHPRAVWEIDVIVMNHDAPSDALVVTTPLLKKTWDRGSVLKRKYPEGQRPHMAALVAAFYDHPGRLVASLNWLVADGSSILYTAKI